MMAVVAGPVVVVVAFGRVARVDAEFVVVLVVVGGVERLFVKVVIFVNAVGLIVVVDMFG